jgi:hypothetical protein
MNMGIVPSFPGLYRQVFLSSVSNFNSVVQGVVRSTPGVYYDPLVLQLSPEAVC